MVALVVLSELLLKLVLLVSPVAGILTDPGPLCPEERVTLNCTTPETELLVTWSYGDEQIHSIRVSSFTDPVTMETLGVQFTLSLLPTSATMPNIVSQLMFVADNTMNGRTLRCEDDTVTLQVGIVLGI